MKDKNSKLLLIKYSIVFRVKSQARVFNHVKYN